MAELNKEFIVNLKGNYKHGLKGDPIYNVWKTMRQRCFNPNCYDYDYYGGRGISICKDWNDASVFYNWAIENGYKKGLTLDRVDNNLGYSAKNCRWVDMVKQNNNRRDNNLITYKGETKTLSEWSRITGWSRTTLYKRKLKGWKVDKILSNKDWRVKNDSNK